MSNATKSESRSPSYLKAKDLAQFYQYDIKAALGMLDRGNIESAKAMLTRMEAHTQKVINKEAK